MRKSVIGVAIVCLAVVASNASAAIISVDWKTLGDNLITRDTNSGLDWLDLSASSERSVIDVSAQLGAGGDYEGFRYASEEEVRTFFNNAGIPDLSGDWNSLNYQPVLDLQALIGVTRSSFGESFGATGDIFSSLYVHAIGLQQQSNPDSSVFEQGRVITNITLLDRTAFLGHWLIKPVPIPAAVWLFGSGFICLIGMARRKTHS